ncbi:TPA: hypothetical protein U2C09_002065 [Streptococcus suis]|uniref:hypothetical protein n=1 Tax=Streptococcus pluranimalium TaxID=82348 RepID=UPI0024158FDD|nr:hypothetical protein [Streptococcus pluranimalium]WFM80865.1 hypothetical protein P7F70_10400 [Streptococcus pluranimalium]HEM6117427.1 hypothetical protein [Streptococcus suis]
MAVVKNKLLNKIGKIFIICCVLFSLSASYAKKVYADYYSPWHIVSVSGIKERRIIYNGGRPMIQLYQTIKYRRTYTDKGGRVTYQYKTGEKKLGLKSPYSP